jgi:hypothetical protein
MPKLMGGNDAGLGEARAQLADQSARAPDQTEGSLA